MPLIIRPTKSLADRIKVKLSANELSSTTVLGDWYANDIVLSRKQFVLCVSERARLAALLPAAPYLEFPLRLLQILPSILGKIGVPDEHIRKELDQMSPISLAKTQSRSVLGSMTELTYHLHAEDLEGGLRHDDILGISLWLSELISLILPEGTPQEEALRLFGQPKRLWVFPRHPLVAKKPYDQSF